MAVFKIDVRADIGTSVKGLKLDLIEIMKQVNSEKHQIQIQIDPKSLQNIRSQIANVLKEFDTSSVQHRGGSGGSGGSRRSSSQTSEAAQNERLLERIATTARRARELLNNNMESTGSPSFDKLSNSVKTLEDILSLCGHTAEDLETALEIIGVNGTDAIARTSSAMATLQEELQGSGTQGGFTLKNVLDTYTQMSKKLNARPDLANTSEYIDLSNRAKVFKSVIDECRGSTDNLETALTNAGLNGARAIDEAKMLMSQFDAVSVNTEKTVTKTGKAIDKQSEEFKAASKAISKYYTLMSSAGKSRGDVVREADGWKSQSQDNVRLAESLNRAEAEYMACTSAAAANNRTKEQNIELTRREAAEAEKLALELERQANSSKSAAQSAKARMNLMQSTLSTTNRASEVLRNYEHVKRSSHQTSKDAYEELSSAKSALDDMREGYENNTANAEELAQAQDRVRTATKNAIETFKANGEVVNTLGTRVKGLAQKFISWLGVSQIIMRAIRTIKQMITAAKEIDYAMAQLKIVTNATDAEMKQFANTAITLAKSLGKSVTELTKSIETFSRLGYSLSEASELAKYATIMSNVAGVSNEEATTGLTSIVKGFNLNVSDAEHVADILVDVGQKYAVSAGEMMEAYEKSGAALSATNTTLEKSAGLIAAANASVQDASVIGTALKTVSARIRGSKSDLEELGENTDDLAEGFSKYAEEIKALTGFDIMIDDTHFKDLYDIMEGVSSAWDKLSDTQQARVAEILGGTRQLQVISSIIGNWKDAVGAYETAINSAGASSRANAIYMESITAHVDQMKASFEELSTNILNSEFAKFIVDTGKTILEILNGITKLTGTLSTILIGGAIYKGIKSVA